MVETAASAVRMKRANKSCRRWARSFADVISSFATPFENLPNRISAGSLSLMSPAGEIQIQSIQKQATGMARQKRPSSETPDTTPATTPDDSVTPEHVCGQTAQQQQQRIESWFARYERPLVAYAAKMLGGDWTAAHDVTQETFLRLCRADVSKIETRIAAWLFRVCRTRVIDMQRTKHSTAVDPHDIDVADDHAVSPSQPLEAAETGAMLAEQIESLTPRQREVVRLRFSAGLSYAEIADVTGMTTSNVGFHLHAAISRLRQTAVVQ